MFKKYKTLLFNAVTHGSCQPNLPLTQQRLQNVNFECLLQNIECRMIVLA